MEYTYYEVIQAKAEALAKFAKDNDEVSTRAALADMEMFIAEHVNRWTNLRANFSERG
jgi:hypothetical protein